MHVLGFLADDQLTLGLIGHYLLCLLIILAPLCCHDAWSGDSCLGCTLVQATAGQQQSLLCKYFRIAVSVLDPRIAAALQRVQLLRQLKLCKSSSRANQHAWHCWHRNAAMCIRMVINRSGHQVLLSKGSVDHSVLDSTAT